MIAGTINLSTCNCYLLKADNGYVLIDTGCDWEWDAFCSELQNAGVDLADLHHLILTHHHNDHAGLLNQVVVQNPGIVVVMSANAKDLLAKGRNDLPKGGGYLNQNVDTLMARLGTSDAIRTQTFPPYVTRGDDILVSRDASLRELGIGLDGRIIETPGHSTDSIWVYSKLVRTVRRLVSAAALSGVRRASA